MFAAPLLEALTRYMPTHSLLYYATDVFRVGKDAEEIFQQFCPTHFEQLHDAATLQQLWASMPESDRQTRIRETTGALDMYSFVGRRK